MTIGNFTGIGRAVDPRYPTNLAIILLMLAVAAGCGVAAADAGAGARAALDVFFAWALCRELDPDHDLSAFLAAALVLLGLAAAAPASVHLFWLLLVVRVVNRTTGLSATLIDSALVVFLGVRSGYGLFTALAFALDALLRHGRKRQWLFAAAALLLSPWQSLRWAQTDLVVPLCLALLFLPVVHASARLASLDDASAQPVDPARVRCGQLLALAFGLFSGVEWQQQLPLWTAVAAASLWHIGVYLRSLLPGNQPASGS